jgi:hypothetical protein
MKAIFRTSTIFFGLLALASVSQGYYWVSAALRTPLPIAPSPANSGFYLVDAWGRLSGPHYWLMPPCQPFNGILPGPTGAAIQAGNLPHTLLMSKDGMTLGNVPMLGQQQAPNGPPSPPYPQPTMPAFASNGPPMPYGQAVGYPLPPNPYPIANAQVPYGYVPPTPYPLQPAYIQPPMPQPMRPVMPYAMPYPPPYPSRPMPYAMPNPQPMMARPVVYVRDPYTGIWQVQYMTNPAPQPFMPIPGFHPQGVHGQRPMPLVPMQPMGPMGPMGPMAPMGQEQFPFFGPMEHFQPMQPINPMQPPRADMQPMQLPRMEFPPPPQHPVGGGAYPVHPFTRSPRDFFMWGDMMNEERARGNRPIPVP